MAEHHNQLWTKMSFSRTITVLGFFTCKFNKFGNISKKKKNLIKVQKLFYARQVSFDLGKKKVFCKIDLNSRSTCSFAPELSD